MNNLQNIDVKDNKYRYINPAQLILALDVADFNQAKTMIEKVKNEVEFFKIGLELMMSGDYFKVIELLKKYDKKIFADLKIYDIANTVASAVKNLAKLSLDLLTIHSASKDIMLRANEYKGEMKIIAVTILTNLDQRDIISMGFDKNLTINDLVLKKAALTLECGLDGVVSSALEAKMLRQNFGNKFLIITPAIRPNIDNYNQNNQSNDHNFINDDQKRVTNIAEAINNGSSHLVIGRPITKNDNPALIANICQNQITKCYFS